MARRDDIKSQIKKQQNEVYGEETQSGSAPAPESDDNTLTNLRDVVGDDINPGDEFFLADEVMGDEKSRLAGRFDTSEEEEEDDEEVEEDEIDPLEEDDTLDDDSPIPFSEIEEEDED